MKNTLTPRQKQIAVLIGKGYTNKAIAEEIYRSFRTIEKTISLMLIDHGAHNRAHLITILLVKGEITLELFQ